MAQILGWSPRTFIGQERFNLLFDNTPERFVPDLFMPERLRRFERGDCGYASFEALRAYSDHTANPKMIENIETAEVMGDKFISLWRNLAVFQADAWSGRDVQVVHILRDVTSVAASYEARKRNTEDAWDDDYNRGISVWSDSVRAISDTLGYGRSGVRLHLVTYDGLFGENDAEGFRERCSRLYSALGLEYGATQHAAMLPFFRQTQLIATRRQSDKALVEQIEGAVDPALLSVYDELCSRALV